MDYITYYMAGIIATLALCAIRIPDTEVRPMLVLCVFWPITIALVSFVLFWDMLGWKIDMWPGSKRFGFRKPTNISVTGFALTLFGHEFQVFKQK